MNNCINCDLILPALEAELDRLRAQRRRAIELAQRLLVILRNDAVTNKTAWVQGELETFVKSCP
jgi:hypothetical protein